MNSPTPTVSQDPAGNEIATLRLTNHLKPESDLSSNDRERLAELRAGLARFELPGIFRFDLEEYLSVDEKAKLELFAAIKTGLSESATVFQPRRYANDSWGEKSNREANLWLKAFWLEGVRTASAAAAAFERHVREGHRFPPPASILKLTSPAPTREGDELVCNQV